MARLISLRPNKNARSWRSGLAMGEWLRKSLEPFRPNAGYARGGQCPTRLADLNEFMENSKPRIGVKKFNILLLFCFRKRGRIDSQEKRQTDASHRRNTSNCSCKLRCGRNGGLRLLGQHYFGFWYQKIATATRSTVMIQRTMSLARFFSLGSAISVLQHT